MLRCLVSAVNINTLLELWAESLSEADGPAPFKSHQHMHATINASVLGDVSWQCLAAEFSGAADGHASEWMQNIYDVWYCNPDAVITNMLSSPDFARQFDLQVYIDLDAYGERQWGNFMSGYIAWWHSVSVQYSHSSLHTNQNIG